MITIDIPGGRVPALGFGTWRLFGEEAERATEHALAVGYRHIDTAQSYENEEQVGRALRASGLARGEVFLTTKVDLSHARREDLLRSTDESLRRLGTDYVDLLLLHWPNPDVPMRESVEALEEAQEAGRARHIGVSNFPPELLEEALAIAPGLVNDQVEYHPFLAQEELLAVVRKHGTFLTAYSPLARGRVLEDETIRRIAEGHGKTPAQVTLRWLLQQERVAAIPKSATPARIEANFDIFDFELSGDEMERIAGLARGERIINPEWGPFWESAG